MLAIEHLKAWYGHTQALFDVSIRLEPGSVLALVGTNGAGKTTLVRALLGLVRTEGRISWDGQDISHWPTHRRVRECRIAVVHETNNLFGELTVRENLMLGMPRDAAQRIPELASSFPVVTDRLMSPVSSLSGGQRQMVALARVLLGRPRLIVLDEPTLGLSPAMIDEIYATIRQLATADTAVLLIEQNLRQASTLATSLQLISVGRSSDPVDAGDPHQVQRLQEVAFGMREIT